MDILLSISVVLARYNSFVYFFPVNRYILVRLDAKPDFVATNINYRYYYLVWTRFPDNNRFVSVSAEN